MPFNLGPMELILLLLSLGFGTMVALFVGRRLLSGSRKTERLEDLKDKVELLEYQLEDERQRRERLPE
ncbi:MAG: hypothetical protein OXI71_12275 [Gemmatimonadota bacterium]|nr:hypothetical protein [Gemmatimonadota bacterium]